MVVDLRVVDPIDPRTGQADQVVHLGLLNDLIIDVNMRLGGIKNNMRRGFVGTENHADDLDRRRDRELEVLFEAVRQRGTKTAVTQLETEVGGYRYSIMVMRRRR